MIRGATRGDLPAVHALFDRWAAAVDEPRIGRETIELEWARPGFDPARDHWLDERDGAVAGYATLKPGGGVVARGAVADLLPLVAARARERGEAELETIVTTRATEVVDALEAAGWERLRDVHRMWLDLAADEPEPRFPDDIRVRAYAAADAERLHAFLELAYSQNNERIEPFDEWLQFMTRPPDFEPPFWHLAEAGDELAGCALTWAPGDGRGWIKDLAVHPGHRRRGLGEALLHHAHAAYRAARATTVGLKVDADNPTQAGRLYARLGYVTDRVYAILTTRP